MHSFVKQYVPGICPGFFDCQVSVEVTFAGLQTIGTVLLPFASAYKDVFAFAVVIAIMAWRPTGLIQEKISERV